MLFCVLCSLMEVYTTALIAKKVTSKVTNYSNYFQKQAIKVLLLLTFRKFKYSIREYLNINSIY